MFSDVIPYFIAIVVTAIAILLSVGIKELAGFLKVKLGANVFEFLKARALTYVAALKQDPAWRDFENSEKKQRAILWLQDFALEFKITLPLELADRLVEEAYLQLKDRVLPGLEDTLNANLLA